MMEVGHQSILFLLKWETVKDVYITMVCNIIKRREEVSTKYH